MQSELINRLQWSFKKRGVGRTLALCARHSVSYSGEWLFHPLAYRRRALQRHEAHLIQKQFDSERNIETYGEVNAYRLKAASSNLLLGHRYQATGFELRDVIRNLGIAYEHFVFVDFGSGKGRALFMASDFPFKRIVGIEFSPDLNDIAERNIKKYRNQDQQCYVVESLCMDAVDYLLPSEPAVLYFYNPFQESVMQRVLANICASFYRHPREMRIVYNTPTLAHLFDRVEFLRRIETPDNDFALYRSTF